MLVESIIDEDADDRASGLSRAATNWAACQDTGVQAVPFFDDSYPDRLGHIDDLIVLLFVKVHVAAFHGSWLRQ